MKFKQLSVDYCKIDEVEYTLIVSGMQADKHNAIIEVSVINLLDDNTEETETYITDTKPDHPFTQPALQVVGAAVYENKWKNTNITVIVRHKKEDK